nr:MAG TPA: hypothetical protein [Caudoviricetes sp.]
MAFCPPSPFCRWLTPTEKIKSYLLFQFTVEQCGLFTLFRTQKST